MAESYHIKDFLILHSLGGYDEISLTGPFKYFYNGGEEISSAAMLGLPQLSSADLAGGSTMDESAKIFMNVLEGKGTVQQNAVVIANAGMALYCANQKSGLPNAIAKAKDSLESGNALTAFKKLIDR